MRECSGVIHTGDALAVLRTLPPQSAQCCVTSPPYWGLRDYGVSGQLGLESTPGEYVAAMMPVFAELWRVLRDDGTLWLNLGDTYAGYHGNRNAGDGEAPSDKAGYRENMRESSVGAGGLKQKDLAGIPWRVAFALQDVGWYLRCDIIWHKPNPMPESVADRPTRAHEYLFLLSKRPRYYFDSIARREITAADLGNRRATKHRTVRLGVDTRGGGQGSGAMSYPVGFRNRRSVWSIPTHPFPDAHFATFPPDLVRPCIRAGAPEGATVLDPFFGAGTVGVVCVEERRRFVGIELNPDYVAIAQRRLAEARPNGFEQASLFAEAVQ